MLKIYPIYPLDFSANTYLLTADDKTCVAIDPAKNTLDRATKLGLEVKAVLLTHGHFDHVRGCLTLDRMGVPIYCAKKEKDLVTGENSLYAYFDAPMPAFNVVATLQDNDKITLCGMTFTVIETAGHTVGSVTYQIEDNLFTGDTLFQGSVGRTDFPTGDSQELEKSVKTLYALQGDYTVYSGHGEVTSLDNERKYNYCIRE